MLVVDGVDLMVVIRVLVLSTAIKRMTLALMNVEQLACKNPHVLAMLYPHNNIALQIDAMFMETFWQQILFWDGKLGQHHILYQQYPTAVAIGNVGNE